MAMSDRIEAFILELLKEDDGWLEIGRNELASVFNCVPSQINYVIATRFNTDRGYVVESKRGGGGCLRIKRLVNGGNNLLCDTVSRIGDRIDRDSAKSTVMYLADSKVIDEKDKMIILAAIGEKSLPQTLGTKRDELRAGILKNILTVLM